MSKGTRNFIIAVVCVLSIAGSLVMPAVQDKCFRAAASSEYPVVGVFADEIRYGQQVIGYRTMDAATGIACYQFGNTTPQCVNYR